MMIKVLGAAGSEVPGHNSPAFLVDGKMLLDAGTVAKALNIREERALRCIPSPTRTSTTSRGSRSCWTTW
jgi:hypothetical protein